MNRELLEKPFTPEQIKRRQGTNGGVLDYIAVDPLGFRSLLHVGASRSISLELRWMVRPYGPNENRSLKRLLGSWYL